MLVRHLAVGALSLPGAIFLVRSIGNDDWATYSVAYFLIVFLDITFGANVLGGLIRSPRGPGRRDLEAAVSLMHVVGLGTTALLLVLAFPAADLYGDDRLAGALVAVAACGYVYAWRSTSLAVLERRLEYRWVAAAEILDQVTFYAIAVPLVLAGLDFTGVAIGLAARGVLAALLVRWHAPAPVVGRLHRPEVRRLIEFAVPTLGSAAFFLANGLVAVSVLGASRATELAFFLTVGTIAGYAAVPQVIAQRVGFPAFASLQLDHERFRRAVARTAGIANVVIVTLLVPLAGLSPLWLPVLFGDEWNRAGMVMAIYGVGLLFNGFVTVGIAALNSLGHPRDVFVLQATMTVLYLVAAVVLVSETALLGVAIAFALSRALATAYALVRLHHRGHPVPWQAEIAVLAAASAALVGLAALAETEPVAALGTCAALAGVWIAARRQELGSLRSLSASGSAPAASG